MEIGSIPSGYDAGIELHHLRAFDALLRERSLTRAAGVLGLTQPALSKTLARLRRYFNDPLFVRVSLRMEPTAKALGLEAPVRAVLDRMRVLRTEHVPFDPKTSARTFNFCVVDAGLIRILPPLVNLLLAEAPRVRLSAVQFDAEHLDPWLETGAVDFAMGAFEHLSKGIRRQPLWTEHYVSVVKKDHPRLSGAPSLKAFTAERHVLISTFGAERGHRMAERAVEAAIPAENVLCRVPIFLAASVIAKHTDAVATLPASIANVLADELNLDIVIPPIKLPKIEVSQYWHERFHREPGNQWIRSIFARLFRARAAVSRGTTNVSAVRRQAK